MFQVTLTLPTFQHNGTDNTSIVTAIQQDIARSYGGYSAQAITGGWYDDVSGKFYYDSSVLTWTFVKTQEQVNELKRKASQWARDLQQIELLVTVSHIETVFIDGTRIQAAA